MKNENNENLKELLAKFFDVSTAATAAEDIAEGERILDANPAPEPSSALLNTIIERMAVASHRHHRMRNHFVWRYVAAVAALAVIAWAGIVIFQNYSEISQSDIRQAFWQESSENSIEAQLAQIEQNQADEPVLTFEVSSTDDTPAINEISNELTEVEDSFLEG